MGFKAFGKLFKRCRKLDSAAGQTRTGDFKISAQDSPFLMLLELGKHIGFFFPRVFLCQHKEKGSLQSCTLPTELLRPLAFPKVDVLELRFQLFDRFFTIIILFIHKNIVIFRFCLVKSKVITPQHLYINILMFY